MQEFPRIEKKCALRAALHLLLAATTVLLVGIAIFRNFLFGDSVLLYTDIGSDSLNFSYPQFVHFSDYVRNEGLPSWSFRVGMGQDIFYLMGFFLLHPVAWLPRQFIAHALIYEHLARSLFAGLSLFCFFQLRNLKLPAALLGALLFAYSAYMCMGSCWHGLSDEVVCFSALLLAAEVALKRGLWFILALAVGFVGLLGAFYLYFAALFLSVYVPARVIGHKGWQPRVVVRTCVILAGAAVLGVGLAAILLGPNLYAALNSPRGSGTTSSVGSLSALPIFGFESSLHYVTAALRSFANDMLGTGDDFQGWRNYLEAPATYCGLICLVSLPQVFVGAAPRHRLIYALLVAGILLTTAFPWFRHLFWLFQGDYYRAHSLFTILGVLVLSMTAFSNYVEGQRLNPWLLAGTIGTLLAVLFLPFKDFQAHIDSNLRREATIFLVLYGALFICGQLLRKQRLTAWCMVLLAAIELVRFDSPTVSNRKTLTKAELTERTGYNDETVDAVRHIRSIDRDKFFRITKLYASAPSSWLSLNDAMVFGYYGTPSYSSFNNLNYINFLIAVDALPPNSESGTRWSLGLMGHAALSIFAGEKYVLTEDPAFFYTAGQYEGIGRYGEIYLLSNELFLPLGLTFARYVPEKVFRPLPAAEKAEVLLRAVVLSNQSEAEKLGLSPIALSDLEQEIRNSSLAEVVAARRTTALDLTRFQQTRIEGKVLLEKKSVLVVQTPFDRGWHAVQDGQPAEVLKVDVGLLGVVLDAGEHKVELNYRNPYLAAGMAVSLASLLILAAGVWRWPRLRLAHGA
jgi:hypothetical protein